VLKSWAVPRGPSPQPADKRLAVMTEDHPYDYDLLRRRDPPKQYGAGEVIVWDCGPYTPTRIGRATGTNDRARPSASSGRASPRAAERHASRASSKLLRAGPHGRNPKTGSSSSHKEPLRRRNRHHREDHSVSPALWSRTSRPCRCAACRRRSSSLPEGRKRYGEAPSLLAESRDAVFTGAGWLWEPSSTLPRARFHRRQGGEAALAGAVWTSLPSFPKLAAELAQQAVKAWYSTARSRRRSRRPPSSPRSRSAYSSRPKARDRAGRPRDAGRLFTASICCTSPASTCAPRPYADRRRWLEQCLFPSPHVQLFMRRRRGRAVQGGARERFEGVIAKRKTASTKRASRSPAWLKIKPTRSAEFVVGGVTRERFARAGSAPAPRLLGRGQAALLRTRRLGVRRSHARPGEGALREAANRSLPVLREAGAPQPTTW